MNLETGEKTFVSKDFDSNVDSYCWSADCKRIYFTGVWHGESQVYQNAGGFYSIGRFFRNGG